jgi:NAD-dependent dihydropyrimidine dehydrogenase PreA subunit
MTYLIGAACIDIKDKSCVDECPVDCIYEGERMLYIHPDECIDCGVCESVCPTQAIVSLREADEGWLVFEEATREVFKELGLPGGASRFSEPLPDPAVVRDFQVGG